MSRRPRVMVCFGTRPEVIKLAPVIRLLERDASLSVTTVTTAQHREMLDQMLRVFAIEPDLDLGLMRANQDLAALTGRAVAALGEAIADDRPAAVLVQGDTTTAFCAALAAFYAGVPVGHVEAGLRSGDMRNPFPEELNRRLVSIAARWHFCPTTTAAENLLAEGVGQENVLVTGNTVIDALLATAGRPLDGVERSRFLPPRLGRRRILVTLHRRETQGSVHRELSRMLARVARRPDVDILLPMHLSPAVREAVTSELSGRSGVRLVEPLEYPVFVHALRTSYLVVTDSGGVQEEAPTFDVPVLVMRETTERPEGVAAGCARVSGIDPLQLERDIHELLDEPAVHARMAAAPSPYGDGRAAPRIVSRLRQDLCEVRESSFQQPLGVGAHGGPE